MRSLLKVRKDSTTFSGFFDYLLQFVFLLCQNQSLGIDVVFYGNQEQLEYDFVLAPGADPGQIALAMNGAARLMALFVRRDHSVRPGNVRRIVIKQGSRSVAEFPLTVGVVGAVLAPVLAAVGAIAALLGECSIEVERVETSNQPKP